MFNLIGDIIIEYKFGVGNKDDIIFHIFTILSSTKCMFIKEDNLFDLYGFIIIEGVTTE